MRYAGVGSVLIVLTVLAAPPAARAQLEGQAAGRARPAAEGVHTSGRHAFRVVTVAEGLDHPWSMAWLPNGDLLVTERRSRSRASRGCARGDRAACSRWWSIPGSRPIGWST